MRKAIDTPSTVEEISAEWLTAALSLRHPGVKVDSLVIEDVMRGRSTKVRVRPQYSPSS